MKIKPELSLYFHFPFCKRKCYYCDFNSYSGLDQWMPEYAKTLISELKRFLPERRLIRSVYFGGGTPSYFPAQLLIEIFQFIKENFLIGETAEVTIEVNPGTIGPEGLSLLHEAGFNRLSLGLQATQDELLAAIGRIHNWQDFLAIYQQARKVGFTNIGLDLICGLPGQTVEDWRDSLQEVVSLNPEHISAYALQLETGTPLDRMVAEGSCILPSEDEVVHMMQITMDFLRENGYEHYEISNYAKPGFRSMHNLGYWSGRNYLGFGAGASSMDHQERWTNLSDPLKYIEFIHEDKSVIGECEAINHSIAITEAIMLGLRMRSGLDLQRLKASLQVDLKVQAAERIEKFIHQGLLKMQDGHLALTDQGVLVSNSIIAELLAEL